MIRISNYIQPTAQKSAATVFYLRQAIIQFWRFSQFHGRYQSSSLEQRQQIIHQSKS